jgi:hypothetical protein
MTTTPATTSVRQDTTSGLALAALSATTDGTGALVGLRVAVVRGGRVVDVRGGACRPAASGPLPGPRPAADADGGPPAGEDLPPFRARLAEVTAVVGALPVVVSEDAASALQAACRRTGTPLPAWTTIGLHELARRVLGASAACTGAVEAALRDPVLPDAARASAQLALALAERYGARDADDLLRLVGRPPFGAG